MRPNSKWRHVKRTSNTWDSFFSRLRVSLAALNLNKTRHASRWSPLISHSANRVSAYQRKSQLFSLRADRMCHKGHLNWSPAPPAGFEERSGVWTRRGPPYSGHCTFNLLIQIGETAPHSPSVPTGVAFRGAIVLDPQSRSRLSERKHSSIF